MTIKTPSGYQVELKEHLTFGDKLAVKRIIQGAIKLDLSAGTNSSSSPVSLEFMLDAQAELVNRAIEKITLPDGTLITGDFLNRIYSWNEEDGQCVFDKVDEIFGNAVTESVSSSQKKTT